MANTYTQIHIHAIFAVKGREGLIQSEWKDELYKYITSIIQHNNHKILAINGMADHLHVFFGMRPNQSLSELIQATKASSSKWINDKKLAKGRFEWQEGYGAFSYSKSQISDVVNYIQNQELHHAKFNFIEEYKDILNKFGIEYNEQYIFKSVE